MKQLRSALLGIAAVGGQDPALIQEGSRLARAFLADRKAVHPEVAWTAVRVAARNGDRALFEVSVVAPGFAPARKLLDITGLPAAAIVQDVAARPGGGWWIAVSGGGSTDVARLDAEGAVVETIDLAAVNNASGVTVKADGSRVYAATDVAPTAGNVPVFRITPGAPSSVDQVLLPVASDRRLRDLALAYNGDLLAVESAGTGTNARGDASVVRDPAVISARRDSEVRSMWASGLITRTSVAPSASAPATPMLTPPPNPVFVSEAIRVQPCARATVAAASRSPAPAQLSTTMTSASSSIARASRSTTTRLRSSSRAEA